MAIALATMYRTLVAQRALTAQRAAAAAAAAPPAPRPTAVSIARQIVTRQAPTLQAAPRPSVLVASTPAPASHKCGSCSSPSSAAGAGAPAASAAPSLALASVSLPAPAIPDSAKAAGPADPDAAAVPTEETGGPSLLIWILIAVAIWWVVTRERGGRSLW